MRHKSGVISEAQFDALKAIHEKGEMPANAERLWEIFLQQVEEGRRHEGSVRYAFAILKEFDNYGSDSLDCCVREVTGVVGMLRARETELQTRMSGMQNELRMWKSRAEAKEKLLSALLLLWSNRWGYDGDDANAQSLIREVSERNDRLEADAWSGAVNELRAFVQSAGEYMVDYAPDLVKPMDGDDPKSAFIQRWVERAKTFLKRA